jgi:4-hydroxy-tetrahydrodipicolinate reductase
MKIAIIGYGKLGKAVEEAAMRRGHQVVLKVTKSNAEDFSLQDIDIAIETTNPESAISNIHKCIDAGIPVVVGTTGWYQDYDAVVQKVKEYHGSLLTATNFSIGVHLFWEANKHLASLMNKVSGYDVSITEIHHIHKKDAPSGTAITTAELLLGHLKDKSAWKLKEDKMAANEIPIESVREGDARGVHIVRYQSAVDIIELKHEAVSREGFGLGAVLAAEFLLERKGVFTMADVIKNIIS